jgi:hypothetical protein
MGRRGRSITPVASRPAAAFVLGYNPGLHTLLVQPSDPSNPPPVPLSPPHHLRPFSFVSALVIATETRPAAHPVPGCEGDEGKLHE